MSGLIEWLEAREGLAGWAQFFGAMLALMVTYLTAFMPMWRRRRQLRGEATRLLMNGYEVIESYYRTSEHFAPFPLSLRQASLTMTAVIDDIGRFPVYELDNNFGSMSLARRLMTMRLVVGALKLFMDTMAAELEARDDHTASDMEWVDLRGMVEDRLKFAEALLLGTPMTRPEWPASEGEAPKS